MILLLSRKSSQTTIKALRFCIKISSFKTSMLQFLKKTKFSNLPLELCKSMQRLWSTSKKPSSRSFPSTSCRDGLLTRCLGMSPKLATAQLSTVPQPCFSKMAAEDHRSGQSSSVSTKKLLMKPEVNQCYHAFQEDFII